MKCLITGCAGFIGSHTTERFLNEGCEVIGVDDFDPYYPRPVKERNLEAFSDRPAFRFIEGDLNDIALEPLLREVDSVIHLAAQPGVRASWGEGFSHYLRNNVLCTQRLLESCSLTSVKQFVLASSSSVYGASSKLPVDEDNPTVPISPYGITKLCAEKLCEAYQQRLHISVVRLRYFSVYGPRQRPDMLMYRIIRATLRDEPVEIYGDGNQTRDFTYVGDVATANWLTVSKRLTHGVANIASGAPVAVINVVQLAEELIGRAVQLRFVPEQKGDPLHTHAATSHAKELFGFEATTPLRHGLQKQLEWQIAHPA